MLSTKKVPSNMCKICWFRSSCTCSKYHSHLCSQLIHSTVSNDFVCQQWRPWSDCRCAGWAEPSLSAHRPFLMARPISQATFFHPESTNIPLVSLQNHMLWYSLELPHQGTSNEYPQCIFLWKNKRNIYWIPQLIWSYTGLCIYIVDAYSYRLFRLTYHFDLYI